MEDFGGGPIYRREKQAVAAELSHVLLPSARELRRRSIGPTTQSMRFGAAFFGHVDGRGMGALVMALGIQQAYQSALGLRADPQSRRRAVGREGVRQLSWPGSFALDGWDAGELLKQEVAFRVLLVVRAKDQFLTTQLRPIPRSGCRSSGQGVSSSATRGLRPLVLVHPGFIRKDHLEWHADERICVRRDFGAATATLASLARLHCSGVR